MEQSDVILLISRDLELHRFLEIVASTYNCTILEADNAEEGLKILQTRKPTSVIFDLNLLSNPSTRIRLKKSLQASEVPILFLHDGENGDRHHDDSCGSFEVEPIVQFVLNNQDKTQRNQKTGLLKRLIVSLGSF